MSRRQQPAQPPVRRGVLIAGVAVLAAALSFAVVNFLFLGGGGEVEEATPSPVAPSVAPADPTPAPSAESAEELGLFEGRDPFSPIAGGTPAPVATSTPAPTADVAAATAAPSESGKVVVEVVSVAEDQSVANVRVNGTLHERAGPGAALSDGVTLKSIKDSCVTFEDSKGTFTVCEGARVER